MYTIQLDNLQIFEIVYQFKRLSEEASTNLLKAKQYGLNCEVWQSQYDLYVSIINSMKIK